MLHSKRYCSILLVMVFLCALLLPFANAEAAPSQESEQQIPAYSSIKLYRTSATLTVYELYDGIGIKSSKPAGATKDQMTYTSSNPKVAAVESGSLIRAIAPGSATITVKAKNGKAKATFRVKVVGFNKNLRFYDAAKDAEGVTQKAPFVDDSALARLASDRSVTTIDKMDQALMVKYGKDAAALSLPKVNIESAGGELYYALLYTILKNEAFANRRGYIVIPSQFQGCSEATMAALRTWLRESFDGIVIGMSEDYFGENAPFNPNALSNSAGLSLTIENVVPVNATCFIADVQQWYGEKGASWHRVLLERTNDGWRIDFSAITIMA